MSTDKAIKENSNLPIFSVRQRACKWYFGINIVDRFNLRMEYCYGEQYKKRDLTEDEIVLIYNYEHAA